MTTSPSPLSITAVAHMDARLPHLGHPTTVRVPLPVTNSGTRTAVITVHRLQITGLARHEPAVSWLRGVRPGHFTLAPGATHDTTLVLRVPANTTGLHELNVQFQATIPAPKAERVHAGIEAGSTVEIHQPGPTVPTHAAAYAHPGHATPPGPQPWEPIGAAALALAAAATAATLGIRRARRRRAHRRQLHAVPGARDAA